MSPPLDEPWVPSVRAAIYEGRKIHAIKLYREASGTGLADARRVVEQWESDLRQEQPTRFAAPRGPTLWGARIALTCYCVTIGAMSGIGGESLPGLISGETPLTLGASLPFIALLGSIVGAGASFRRAWV